MSEVIERDPALAKLLDELPQSNPDDPPMAEVWIDGCPNRVIIPLNTPTSIVFGKWSGPPIPMSQIEVKARVGCFAGKGPIGVMGLHSSDELVIPGRTLSGEVTVVMS